MLHNVATIISLLLAFGAIALIWASIADDWEALRCALQRTAPVRGPAVPPRVHARSASRARILGVKPQAVSLRAAA